MPVEFSGPPPLSLTAGIAEQRGRIEELRAAIDECGRQTETYSRELWKVAGESTEFDRQLSEAMLTLAEMEGEAGIIDGRAWRRELRYLLARRHGMATGIGLLLSRLAAAFARQSAIGRAIVRAHRGAGDALLTGVTNWQKAKGGGPGKISIEGIDYQPSP